MTDPHATHDTSWEEALEEAFHRLEQGEAVTDQQFAELLAELQQRRAEMRSLPEEDPRRNRLAELMARAEQLEASAAKGRGPTDEVSSMLGGLVGQPTSTTAPAIPEVEGLEED